MTTLHIMHNFFKILDTKRVLIDQVTHAVYESLINSEDSVRKLFIFLQETNSYDSV